MTPQDIIEIIKLTCGMRLEIPRSDFVRLYSFEPESAPSLFRTVTLNPGGLGDVLFVRPTQAWLDLREQHRAEVEHRRSVIGVMLGRIIPNENELSR